MANYYASSRTNYFKVKDEAAFRAWSEKWKLEIAQNKDGFAVFPNPNSDSGVFDLRDEDEDDSLDFAEEIAAHLTDDSIAVVMESGAEKLRYITGWAIAINSKGKVVQVSLDDIYKLALKEFGIEPTEATY